MKLFPALLLLFLTFPVATRVESSVWSKSLDGIHGDFGQSASPTSDGGAIFSGITKSGYEGYLIKMNSTGNIQWQKVFGRPSVNNGVQLLDAIQTLDDGYIAVGASHAGLALTADIIIIKTNSQGVVIWTHIYSISGDEFGYRVRETKDGGFMIAGYSFPVIDAGDLFLLRLDPQGVIIWQKTIDGGGFETFPDLQTTTDGNFVLAAYTDSFSQNALVMKFDGAGNTIWSKRYGGPGFEGIRGIQQTQDGGYIAVGWTQKTTTTDLWLLKLSPSGSIQWQYQYGGSNHDVGQSLVVGNEGNLFVAGYTDSFGSGGIDIWLLKLNAAGKILFEKTYGGTDHDWPIYAGLARDGGIFVTGLNRLASRFRQTAFVLKLNSSGELNSCSRLTLANSKAAVRATTATTTVVQFNITDTNLLELPTDEIRMTNGFLRSITDCNLITAVNPSSAPPGSVIQLNGLGFGSSQGDSQIFIGQRSTGTAISWSDTKITLRIPNDAQTAGLTFQNRLVKTVPLEYPILPPAGKRLWPLNGPSQGKTRVVIPLNTNFDGLKVEKVLFGTNEATNISLSSKNLLLCTSPAGTGTVTVTVFSGATSFAAGQFVYR